MPPVNLTGGISISLSAKENIYKYLPKAVADGNDIEAREHVAYASTMTVQFFVDKHACETTDEDIVAL